MSFRPVYPRASLMAVIAASVPEDVMRIRSIDGRAEEIISAMAVSSSVGAPKLVPCFKATRTAAVTSGWAWPRIIGPHEST